MNIDDLLDSELNYELEIRGIDTNFECGSKNNNT
jgi:hypothetical protein